MQALRKVMSYNVVYYIVNFSAGKINISKVYSRMSPMVQSYLNSTSAKELHHS